MRRLGDLAQDILDASKSAAAARKERLTSSYASLRDYIADHPSLSQILPNDLSLEDLLLGSSDDSIEAAEERLQLCARCDGRPARCAGRDDQILPIGHKPIWTEQISTEECALYRQHVLYHRLHRGGVPKELLSCTLDSYRPANGLQKTALKRCREFVANFDARAVRRGILIMGDDYGVGKTHLAVGVMRALVESRQSRKPMFVFVPEFLDRIRRSFNEKNDSDNRMIMERARTADLLVLDDLGSEQTTEWVREQLTIILNARWSEGRPVIVTSNALMPGIRDAIGDRAMSRLRGCVTQTLILRGEDRRRG